MPRLLIKNAAIVNESKTITGHILIEDGIIIKIYDTLPEKSLNPEKEIDATGKICIPGIIDDQVHFREPGLTHKADIYHEAKAAAAGGVTSFMEMPNTIPQSTTQETLSKKYEIAEKNSLINYSFYIGATNTNLEELLKTDPENVCGIKIFMGSSTGNMLVDNLNTLEQIFSKIKLLIATHCEDENIIIRNTMKYKNSLGKNIPIRYHPLIRDHEACYKSSSLAVKLAKKYNSRLHILHISTAKELSLFTNKIPCIDKKITSEVCVHHLWFNDQDYEKMGVKIKWNPAIKTQEDQEALLEGVIRNKIDVIATDHAPHTLEEKNNPYFKSPSGGPLIQHSLVAMIEFYKKNKITLEKIVEKMCHHPADIFMIDKRGYIREGYQADIAILDLNKGWKVNEENILSKCKWSPFDGCTFSSSVTHTIVNGNIVYENGIFHEEIKGMRLKFNR